MKDALVTFLGLISLSIALLSELWVISISSSIACTDPRWILRRAVHMVIICLEAVGMRRELKRAFDAWVNMREDKIQRMPTKRLLSETNTVCIHDEQCIWMLVKGIPLQEQYECKFKYLNYFIVSAPWCHYCIMSLLFITDFEKGDCDYEKLDCTKPDNILVWSL